MSKTQTEALANVTDLAVAEMPEPQSYDPNEKYLQGHIDQARLRREEREMLS